MTSQLERVNYAIPLAPHLFVSLVKIDVYEKFQVLHISTLGIYIYKPCLMRKLKTLNTIAKAQIGQRKGYI